MAVLNYLGQVPAQWFDASGNAALAGGKLQFFEVGTTTPKAVYSDYQGNTSAGTVVTLDSSGRANIWLAGLYSVQLTTAADVPIGNRVDGIGTELAPNVEASAVLSVAIYADLRALTGANVRVCAVEGRAANGDGGAGLFAWDDTEAATDDGGTILTPDTNPISGRWVRIFSGDLQFRWFGDITGTDDTTAYALALVASASRKRWLAIEDGVVRLTSSVSAPSGSMIRFALGGAITSASSLVFAGFPSTVRLEGATNCFRENLSVSIGVTACSAIVPTWWDKVNDDARLAAACIAPLGAMEIDISRQYTLTSDFDQQTNAVLAFRNDGKLVWQGAGAVDVVIRRFTTASPTAPRFVFESVAKLASLSMTERRGVYLSPSLFGAVGSGLVDDAPAVWPAILHGLVQVDAKYLVGSSLTAPADLRLTGEMRHARELESASEIPHGIYLGNGVNLDVTGDLSISGTGIEATNASQSEITVGGSLTLSGVAIFGQDNAGVSSLGISAPNGAEVSGSQIDTAPIYAPSSSIRDSEVYGASSFDALSLPQIGLGGSAWTIDRCYIERVNSMGVSRIADSVIASAANITYVDECVVRDSTISPTGSTSTGIASGSVSIRGGGVTLPLIGTDAGDIVLDGFPFGDVMPWNGFGTMTISGGSETVNNGGATDANILRRGAIILDGVIAPRSTDTAAMGALEVPTTSTTGWDFGGGHIAPPTVAGSTFLFGEDAFSSSPWTIAKNITTDAEKTLAAYGGYVVIEWTGDASSIALICGAETITAEKCPGATAQRAVYHIWPGALSATTKYEFRITYGGGAMSLNVSIRPCAPTGDTQWRAFWGVDRTLSASRYNTWKGTLVQGDALALLDCWIDSLPVGPLYTPRPQTLQPWLTTLAAPVRLYTRNQIDILSLFPDNPFYSGKIAGSAFFYTYTLGAR